MIVKYHFNLYHDENLIIFKANMIFDNLVSCFTVFLAMCIIYKHRLFYCIKTIFANLIISI